MVLFISHATESVGLVALADVRRRGIVRLAGGAGDVLRAFLPRAAAQDAFRAAFRAARILPAFGILRVEIVAPFCHVAVHVVQPERVGLLLADRLRGVVGVVARPRMGGELLFIAVEIQLARGACAAGVLPFGLRRQTIAVGGEIAFPRAGRVARRQAFRLGAEIAEQRGVRPADAFDGMVVMLEFRGILAHDFRSRR